MRTFAARKLKTSMDQTTQRLTTANVEMLERMGATHYENDLFLFDRHALHNYTDRIFRLPYALIAFVDQGEADVLIEGQPYHVVANDHLLLLLNQEFCIRHMAENFHAQFVLLSRSFIQYITTDDSYRFIQQLRQTPLVHLQPYTINAFCSCYDLLKATIAQHENPYRKQMLHHIIKTYIYGVVYYVQPQIETSYSREEEITYHFLNLVDEHYRQQHSLQFYAEQMHLSSKHISKCVKKVIGRNAIQCIADKLIRQAEAMLKVHQSTVAQIGYELGFSDPSSFGKFFRAHEHMGPREWMKENG